MNNMMGSVPHYSRWARPLSPITAPDRLKFLNTIRIRKNCTKNVQFFPNLPPGEPGVAAGRLQSCHEKPFLRDAPGK